MIALATNPDGTPDAVRVALVGCSKAKGQRRAQALTLYTGRIFRAAVDLTTATHDQTFIVSALHGLVDLEQEVDPYDFTIARYSVEQRIAWGETVVAELSKATGAVPLRVTVLMGESYARWLRGPLARRDGWTVSYPLDGIAGIAPRVQWLRDQLLGAGGLPC